MCAWCLCVCMGFFFLLAGIQCVSTASWNAKIIHGVRAHFKGSVVCMQHFSPPLLPPLLLNSDILIGTMGTRHLWHLISAVFSLSLLHLLCHCVSLAQPTPNPRYYFLLNIASKSGKCCYHFLFTCFRCSPLPPAVSKLTNSPVLGQRVLQNRKHFNL